MACSSSCGCSGQKYSDDILDWDVDFSQWLGPTERILTVDVVDACAVSGPTTELPEGYHDTPQTDETGQWVWRDLTIEGTAYTDEAVKVWLGGGLPGDVWCVRVAVTTNSDGEDMNSFKVFSFNVGIDELCCGPLRAQPPEPAGDVWQTPTLEEFMGYGSPA